ncbi:MAG: division/cell wall cluster transcriptional repressor MraZ [Erysipelotrichaceae bacterium]|nr:division/cell wall cluster transcriptional repressor MraZ [Erysipelotrichaceae bacterium]
MFFGSYVHTLDNKGRLVIPSKLRDEAGTRVYILKGFDGALSIYKSSDFDKMVEEINTLPFNKRNSRAYLRVQLASTCELDVDKQGRVQLPSQLLEKYGIGKDVIVIGVGDHMEVWDKKTYEDYEKGVDKDFESIAEKIEKDEEE